MIPVELSKEADADLDSILDYGIEIFGRAAAEAYLRRINAVLDRLSEYPKLGSPRSDLHKDLRSIAVERHRIYYRLVGESVLVARVLHKTMDVERHL